MIDLRFVRKDNYLYWNFQIIAALICYENNSYGSGGYVAQAESERPQQRPRYWRQLGLKHIAAEYPAGEYGYEHAA